MIADAVVDIIFRKRKAAYLKADREPIFAVYIENKLWLEMMNELRGELSPVLFELYQTQGKKICDCAIHRVLSDGHGIKVFEVGR